MIGTVLNVVTGGFWGVLRWIGRRFSGKEGKRTFLGGVATFVVGHMVLSILYGKADLWTLLRGFGKAALLLCVFILNILGGKGELPPEEDAQAKGFIAKAQAAKDAAEARMKKIQEEFEVKKKKAEEELEEKKRRIEEEIARRKEQENFDRIDRIQREAEEREKRTRLELEREARHREGLLEAKQRDIVLKAKREIRENTPNPFGLFGSSRAPSEPSMDEMDKTLSKLKSVGDGRSKFYCVKCTHVERMRDYGLNPKCQACGYQMNYTVAKYYGETGMRP